MSPPGPPGGLDDEGPDISAPPPTDGERPHLPRHAMRWSFVMSWGKRGFATVFTVKLCPASSACGAVSLSVACTARTVTVRLVATSGCVGFCGSTSQAQTR